jgi:hypothetical protein
MFSQKNTHLPLENLTTVNDNVVLEGEKSFYPELNLNRGTEGWGEKKMKHYHEYALYVFELELDRRHKLRPDLTRQQMYDL